MDIKRTDLPNGNVKISDAENKNAYLILDAKGHVRTYGTSTTAAQLEELTRLVESPADHNARTNAYWKSHAQDYGLETSGEHGGWVRVGLLFILALALYIILFVRG